MISIAMFYESRGYMKCSLQTSTSRTMGVLRKCCIPPFPAILKQETPDKPMDSGDTLELSSLHWFTGKLKPETPIFHGKSMVSSRFSLKPIHDRGLTSTEGAKSTTPSTCGGQGFALRYAKGSTKVRTLRQLL